jgi:hypothetical protein
MNKETNLELGFDISLCPITGTKPYDISKVLTRYKFFEMTRDIPGDIVECGVYKGSGLIAMSNILKLLDPLCINKTLFGFDTFTGFASVCEQDQVEGLDPIENGMLNTGADTRGPSDDKSGFEIMSRLMQYHEKLAAGFPKIYLVQGDLTHCLPSFLENTSDFKMSLLIADVDIFAPSLQIFKHLVPRVGIGGIVGIDDYCNNKFRGCARAFDFFYGNTIKLKQFEHDPWMTYFKVTPEIIKYTKKRALELR